MQIIISKFTIMSIISALGHVQQQLQSLSSQLLLAAAELHQDNEVRGLERAEQ